MIMDFVLATKVFFHLKRFRFLSFYDVQLQLTLFNRKGIVFSLLNYITCERIFAKSRQSIVTLR